VEAETVEIELADGLTVTLPIERAQEQLRPLASESDLRRVQQTLRQPQTTSGDAWPKRQDEARKKLTKGDPVELAELIRDGAHSERARSGKGANPQRPTRERELSAKARELLGTEIAFARGIRPGEAEAWIDEQIAQATRAGSRP
jgi:RNA polymerase-interacting CarD/CdnL/TRCF family regulator